MWKGGRTGVDANECYILEQANIHQANVVVAGISAGFTGTIFGHPLDLIKGVFVFCTLTNNQ